MTRPPRLFTVGLAVVLLLAIWHTRAHSRDMDLLRQRLNNFSHENAICAVYYALVSACVGKTRPNEPAVEQYRKGSQTFLDISLRTGRLAGVSDKALLARIEMATDEMKSDVEGSCSNTSILLQRHGMACKKLFEEGAAHLDQMLN